MSETRSCDFFRWDNDGLSGSTHDTLWSRLEWHSFVGHEYSLYQNKIESGQVRQGRVGNCWFLSALAVVAEKKYLVQNIIPHTSVNEKGCYQVNLCLDGKWTSIIVDAYLPVIYGQQHETEKQPKATLARQAFRGGAVLQGGTQIAFPVFCAVPQGQLWPALVEKAYAKAHGSYCSLSGGFIAEGLSDLTGAPYETIVLDSQIIDKEELWARLLSFSEAGFLLGVATSGGGRRSCWRACIQYTRRTRSP